MNTSVFTLGPKPKRDVLLRALRFPGCVLAVTVVITIWTGKSGWLSVGGAVISALGTLMWAARLFRLGPDRADDPLPPAVFPPQPGQGPGLLFNPDHMNEGMRRALDNWRAYVGVCISIAGVLIGGAAPFLVDQARCWLGH